MYFIFKLPRSFILLIIAGKNIFIYFFSFIVTFHLYRTPCLNEMQISGNRSLSNTIELFKIIVRVNIFLYNFTISGAILLIFHILLGLKSKQNGAWKTKRKNTTSIVLHLCTQNAYQWNQLS